jgi:hypothetical protein
MGLILAWGLALTLAWINAIVITPQKQLPHNANPKNLDLQNFLWNRTTAISNASSNRALLELHVRIRFAASNVALRGR